MRKYLALTLALVTLAAALPAAAQTRYPAINETARLAMRELQVFAGCHIGRAPKVGIWPLRGDSLPIEADSAVAFYEEVFAALNATKPDCVTFVDGASGSDTIQYFMMVGDGAEARARVDEAFRDVEFTLTLDIFDRAGRILADLKIANANAVTVAAPPTFDVHDDFITTACGVGAIPLDNALRVGARQLLETVPDLAAIVNRGGTFGYSEDHPNFTAYFADRMIEALEDQAADTLSGRALRRAGESAFGEDGVYAFSFRYLPCDDGSAAEITTHLTAADGTTASWRGDVRLAGLPRYIKFFPEGYLIEQARGGNEGGDPPGGPESGEGPGGPETSGPDDETGTTGDPEQGDGTEGPQVPKPRDQAAGPQDPKLGDDGETTQEPKPRDVTEAPQDPFSVDVIEVPPVPVPAGRYDLSFSPTPAYVGDVVTIVADVAPGCAPFFLNIYENSPPEIVPWDVFVIEDLVNGGRRFRVDTTTPVGLKVRPEDPKGTHHVGYICMPDKASRPSGAMVREIRTRLYQGATRNLVQGETPVYLFEKYEIR